MGLVTLLLCSLVAFGQSTASPLEPKAQTPASSADQKNQNQDHGSIHARGNQEGSVEILSDTQGVDFKPYIKRIVQNVRENWYHLIPECAEMMKGKLVIEFRITKDGHVVDMRLVESSHAAQLDRAAWGSIVGSNPYPPLPSEFTGQYLALRFRFSYNPGVSGSDSLAGGCSDNTAKAYFASSQSKASSGVSVIVTAPLLGDMDVPLGSSKLVTAMVTGSGSKESTVEWRISGLGCSGTSCGEIIKDSYHAPSVMPSTSLVTLTAVAKADPSAKASITLHIVDSNPSH